jgi:hypothetical protein
MDNALKMMKRLFYATLASGLFVLSIVAVSAFGGVPAAYAGTTITVNDSGSCLSISGFWSGTTCTLFMSYTIFPGDTLSIPSGTTLVIPVSYEVTVDSGGTLQVANTVFNVVSVAIYGTLANSGTITVMNSGLDSIGIENHDGKLTNSGIINIENSGTSIGISNEGSFTNSGTINIKNSGTLYGLDNGGDFTNSGTITVQNTGSNIGLGNIYGDILNKASSEIDIYGSVENYGFGSIDNYGTIIVECGGAFTQVSADGYTPTFTPESGSTFTQDTSCMQHIGVPQFPISALGSVMLIAFLLPALLLISRKFRQPLL